MIGILMKFLPKEYRAILVLGMRIVSQFDTKAEALSFVRLLADSMQDGYVSPTEWVAIGGKSGITTKPKMM